MSRIKFLEEIYVDLVKTVEDDVPMLQIRIGAFESKPFEFEQKIQMVEDNVNNRKKSFQDKFDSEVKSELTE